MPKTFAQYCIYFEQECTNEFHCRFFKLIFALIRVKIINGCACYFLKLSLQGSMSINKSGDVCVVKYSTHAFNIFGVCFSNNTFNEALVELICYSCSNYLT